MTKLFTPIRPEKAPFSICHDSRTACLGSCFADNIRSRLEQNGFDVMPNPFGTLYNPESILDAVEMLDSEILFRPSDCVRMGAGLENMVCSFRHHTSFARSSEKEFLDNANESLNRARAKWRDTDTVIITLGTATVWKHLPDGMTVANCLKRPAAEFTRELLGVDRCRDILDGIAGSHPEKRFILTVSPVRHLNPSWRENTLSKATLHLALEGMRSEYCYFPAWEIMQDELRDYRFCSDDLVHPSASAVDIIWERFRDTFIPSSEYGRMERNAREYRASLHRPNLSE